jgi:type II secretory pathway pseudopilin PulG
MKTIHRTQEHTARAFVLLEVVLALALFAAVAVSMTSAINGIAVASRSARQEARVLRAMESVLAQVAHQPELKEGSSSFPPNAEGVTAEAIVEKAGLETLNKARMEHMFRITVNAWIQDGRDRVMKRRIETYVYAPDSPVA